MLESNFMFKNKDFMTEYTYSLQSSSFINNAIAIFIAFRLARVTNEMGAGVVMKGLASVWVGYRLF